MNSSLPELIDRRYAVGSRALTPGELRELLQASTWGSILGVIRLSRSYSEGLSLAVHLLNLNELYRAQFSAGDYMMQYVALYDLLLDMLDQCDMWEEFIAAYNHAWRDERLRRRCHKKHLKGEFGAEIAKGVVSETRCYVDVHTFWMYVSRMEVVQRKWARKVRGSAIGAMMHHTRADLTPDEVQRRQQWIARIFAEHAVKAE